MYSEAELAARIAKERERAYRELANSIRGLAEGTYTTKEAIEGIYVNNGDRVRLVAALAGVPVAAVSLASGAPAYVVAPRLAGAAFTLLRAGVRVSATRDAYVSLREILEELSRMVI